MKWTITYFNDRVFRKIRKLPIKLCARYLALSDLMLEKGPNLGLPHTKALGNGLLELRVKAKEGIARIFYCTQIEKEIVILHSFVKKSQKLPEKELKIAMKRLVEIKKDAKTFDKIT